VWGGWTLSPVEEEKEYEKGRERKQRSMEERDVQDCEAGLKAKYSSFTPRRRIRKKNRGTRSYDDWRNGEGGRRSRRNGVVWLATGDCKKQGSGA